MRNSQRALEYLEKNILLHMSIIFSIKRGTADIIYAGCDGVFIKEAESGVYMLALDNFEKGKKLVNEIGKQAHICVYRKDIADYLYEKYGYKKYAKNVQAVYRKTEHVKLNSHALDIQPLTLTHLEWVHKYFGHLDYDYLKNRIECGAVYGGRFDGKLCGFVGVHAEGAIGILKVLEKFRKQGFSLELVGYMANILLSKGEIPFSQIEFDNAASIGLHKKLGFEISSDTLYRLID